MAHGNWKLAHVIYEIRELMNVLIVTLVHVLREQNVLADKMANWGVGLPSIFVDSVPWDICLYVTCLLVLYY